MAGRKIAERTVASPSGRNELPIRVQEGMAFWANHRSAKPPFPNLNDSNPGHTSTMGSTLPEITLELRSFIAAQSVFFVASAPLAADGHVNLSPKGLDTFRVLGPDRVAYLDLTGSGNETAAHIADNGRITLMFCAFDGRPMIVRLFGRGRTVLPGTPEWSELIGEFDQLPGTRQLIVADIHRVQTSCGFGVPLIGAETTHRDKLISWAERKGPEGLAEYRQQKNTISIDGIPVAVAD